MSGLQRASYQFQQQSQTSREMPPIVMILLVVFASLGLAMSVANAIVLFDLVDDVEAIEQQLSDR